MAKFTKYKCSKCRGKVETKTGKLIELGLCDDCAGLSVSMGEVAKNYDKAVKLVETLKTKNDDGAEETADELKTILQKYNAMFEAQRMEISGLMNEVRGFRLQLNRKTYRDFDFLLPNIEAVTEQVNKATKLIEMRSKENSELLKLNFGEIQNKSMRKHIDDLSSCLNRDMSVFSFIIASIQAMLIEVIKINKAIREKQKDVE